MPSPSPRSVLLLGSNTVGGGAERFVTDFAQLLATHGDLPHLATLFACEPVSDAYPTISLGHDNVFSSWRTVQRLGKLIDQHRFDIVISNGRYTGQFAAAALRKRQSRWISRIGSPYQNARGGIKEHLGRRYFQRVSRRADAFVCNSHGLSEDLLLTLPNARPVTIPNCIASHLESGACPTATPGSREHLDVLWAGRFVPGKAPLEALEALSIVARDTPVRATFCGDGPLKDEILAKANHVDGMEVEVLPWQDDLPARMRQSDLFLFSSHWEGMPNVLLEAGACGLPCVATDCDFGPREIITAETGCLVDVGDIAAMAESISRLLNNQGLLADMGKAARAHVLANHSSTAIWPLWDSLLCSQTSAQTSTP